MIAAFRWSRGKKQEGHWKPVYKGFIQAGGNDPRLPRCSCCSCRANWYHPTERPETKPVKKQKWPLVPLNVCPHMRVIKQPWAEPPTNQAQQPGLRHSSCLFSKEIKAEMKDNAQQEIWFCQRRFERILHLAQCEISKTSHRQQISC